MWETHKGNAIADIVLSAELPEPTILSQEEREAGCTAARNVEIALSCIDKFTNDVLIRMAVEIQEQLNTRRTTRTSSSTITAPL